LNQKGVTFIELCIYLVLFAIVSLLIGKQFKSLMNSYSAGKQIVRQQTDARDILGLMVREIRKTGLKVYFRTSNSSLIKDTASGTFVSIADPSSFKHFESRNNTYGDTLIIYMARLGTNGDSAGVDTITYYLDSTNLKRDLKNTGTNTSSIVAKNVIALQFQYGIYGIGTSLFKDSLTSKDNWTLVNESGTAPSKSTTSPLKLTFTAAAKGYINYYTQKSVVKNRKYSILLQIESSGGFPDTLDSLRFEFANGSSLYGFEKFKPVSGTQVITIRDSVSGTADMRLRYGASGAGILSIKAVVATTAEDSAFTWVNRFTGGNPDSTAYKKHVRAIKIHVLTRTSGNAGTKVSSNIQVANVSVPRSGEYTWRHYTELVEVPNNGRF
jgi:type II secretory pathway component PulJ